MAVHQAYRFALEPTPAQERALRSHAGAARFAWNWGLARCKERYEAEGRWYSSIDLDRDVNAARNLLHLGTASGAGTSLTEANAYGAQVRPSPAGHRAMNQEPGTAPAGETGPAARQQAAAA